MVIQKDIIVTQGLGLDTKILNHVSKSLLDERGVTGFTAVRRGKWGIVKQCKPQKRACSIEQ